MTTSISGVNAGSVSASSSSNQKTSSLSEETKRKLEALGITVTDNMTESQAASLINSAQQKENDNSQNGQRQDSQSDVRADAKSLAQSMGISVSEDADADEILNDIGEQIEVMLEGAEKNPSILSTISSYLSELTNLDDRYETLQSQQQAVFAALDTVSNNNKLALGLS